MTLCGKIRTHQQKFDSRRKILFDKVFSTSFTLAITTLFLITISSTEALALFYSYCIERLFQPLTLTSSTNYNYKCYRRLQLLTITNLNTLIQEPTLTTTKKHPEKLLGKGTQEVPAIVTSNEVQRQRANEAVFSNDKPRIGWLLSEA